MARDYGCLGSPTQGKGHTANFEGQGTPGTKMPMPSKSGGSASAEGDHDRSALQAFEKTHGRGGYGGNQPPGWKGGPIEMSNPTRGDQKNY